MAIAAGEIFVLAGDREVRNDTLLGFSAAAAPENPQPELSPLLEHWCDELLPDLVLARGQHQAELWGRLRGLIGELARHGVAAFRFRDLLDP